MYLSLFFKITWFYGVSVFDKATDKNLVHVGCFQVNWNMDTNFSFNQKEVFIFFYKLKIIE